MRKYRLLWALSLPPWYGLVIFNYFESRGAVFPIEVVYHPPPPPQIPDSVRDPIERIAWRFYDSDDPAVREVPGAHTGDPGSSGSWT